MASNPNSGTTFKSRSTSIVVPKMADPNAAPVTKVEDAPASTDIWTTERQLVSSLAKLQQLESMVSTHLHSRGIRRQLTRKDPPPPHPPPGAATGTPSPHCEPPGNSPRQPGTPQIPANAVRATLANRAGGRRRGPEFPEPVAQSRARGHLGACYCTN